MTQIAVAAGSSTSVTITAGSRLLLTGQGTYRIGPRGSSQRPTVDELIDSFVTVGPFEDSCTVQIWATGSGATYETVAPTDGVDLTGRPLVSGAGTPVLSAATAGQDSGWVPYTPGMRLAYALDSGSTATPFAVDMSSDGISPLQIGPQAFTGTWASTTAEISPPIYLTNPQARFIRFTVQNGGPLSVIRF